MQMLYNFSIFIYGFLAKIFSFWNAKAKLWVVGRKNWRNQLKQKRNLNQPLLWFHCSSLGEFEQGKPVIEAFKNQHLNHQIAVSFFSPSGYEIRKDNPIADFTFYLPLDTPKNANDLVEILQPDLLVLVKYEYWFNLMTEMSKQKRKMIVISAIFHPHQVYFSQWIGKWFQRKLNQINCFFVQNKESKNLLNQIGIEQVVVSGDTRFDRVRQILSEDIELPIIQRFKGDGRLFVAGSTWPKDEEYLLDYFQKTKTENLKIVIAPHNINKENIKQLQSKIKIPFITYSKITNSTSLNNAKVLILDTMGMLTKVYHYANYAYVGGGFTKSGVHNTLEPAVFGIPIIIGPNYSKFQEVKELIEIGGIKSYKTDEGFNSILNQILFNDTKAKKIGLIAGDYVKNKPNSVATIVEKMKELISKIDESRI